jgi:hypothetical protein
MQRVPLTGNYSISVGGAQPETSLAEASAKASPRPSTSDFTKTTILWP